MFLRIITPQLLAVLFWSIVNSFPGGVAVNGTPPGISEHIESFTHSPFWLLPVRILQHTDGA